MDAFLRRSVERQRVLYEETGRRLGLSAGSVEKDLWVCWTLRALFGLPVSGPHLTFKGGTSLSKGWKLIDRFSEDIDIVIDREFLGFGGADAPEEAPSNKQRLKRLEALMAGAQAHIRDVLSPALEQEIRHLLPSKAAWTPSTDAYPTSTRTRYCSSARTSTRAAFRRRTRPSRVVRSERPASITSRTTRKTTTERCALVSDTLRGYADPPA